MNRKEPLKILAVGNSFSEDAMTYLGEIFFDYGMKEVVLGYLYIGGASLKLHHQNMLSESHDYDYWKNEKNQWKHLHDQSFSYGIFDEPWDIIAFQQASGLSGIESSYEPYLSNLVNHIKETKDSPTVFMWHSTWAYAHDSTKSAFKDYKFSQLLMHNQIKKTVKKIIDNHKEFEKIIPVGDAIQNIRLTEIGDNLTRDGFHLNVLGRYIAALTWFAKITGLPIQDIEYRPKEITENEVILAKEAVKLACEI